MISEKRKEYFKKYRQTPEYKRKARERMKKNRLKKKLELKGGNKKMFKKNKGKPVAPPVDDEEFEDEVEEDEDEEEEEEKIEAIESETKAIKKEIERVTKKKPPVEEVVAPPVEEVEEELTEDKVKEILINFETRLQKIEYNLRLIP